MLRVDRLLPVRAGMHTAATRDCANSRSVTNRIVAHEILLGGSAFTPTDIARATPTFGDRPYAFVLALTTSQKRLDDAARTAVSSDLSIGAVGLPLGGQVQRGIHHLFHLTIPQGWDLQICRGGCPVARYTLGVQHLLMQRTHADAQFVANGTVGYQTHAGIGAAVRVGRRQSPWWIANGDLQTTLNTHAPLLTLQAPAGARVAAPAVASVSAPGSAPTERSWELYGFGVVRLRAVGYNMLLQGAPWRTDPVTLPSSQLSRGIGEFQGGVVGGWRGVNLVFSVSGRTTEFSGPFARSHLWGGLYLSLFFSPISAARQ